MALALELAIITLPLLVLETMALVTVTPTLVLLMPPARVQLMLARKHLGTMAANLIPSDPTLLADTDHPTLALAQLMLAPMILS